MELFSHQSHSQDLREGVRGATGGRQAQRSTWGLEPGPLAGPHDVTQGKDGGAQTQSRTVDGHHDGLLKVDEGFYKIPAGRQKRDVLSGSPAEMLSRSRGYQWSWTSDRNDETEHKTTLRLRTIINRPINRTRHCGGTFYLEIH